MVTIAKTKWKPDFIYIYIYININTPLLLIIISFIDIKQQFEGGFSKTTQQL
jgi:hypothetical protein